MDKLTKYNVLCLSNVPVVRSTVRRIVLELTWRGLNVAQDTIYNGRLGTGFTQHSVLLLSRTREVVVSGCTLQHLAKINIMPSYKLTYFNLTSLGEPIRFLLHQSGIEFEDKRVEFEEWPELKAQMPMGQLPVLEIDDKVLYQSKAICRFIAKQNNLYGADEYEAFQIDATIDTIDDLRHAVTIYHWEQDPGFKAKLKKAALQKLPVYLDKFNEQVKKNGGHFVGGKLTWPDLLWTAYMDILSVMSETELNKNHPELKKLVEKVKALPNIKSYLAKRPKTQF